MGALKKALKERFDYDVSGLPAWNDNTMPKMIPDLIANSEFLGSLTLETGVKGTLEISLLNADVKLQAKEGCTPSPDGAVIFTKKNLTTALLYSGIEFCNEDLNKKMTQVLNKIGLKMQNGQLPTDLETILMAYLLKQLQRKAQRLVVNGDTTSLDDELVMIDGLRKILKTDADVQEHTTTETALDDTNAYDVIFAFMEDINTEIADNEMPVDIYMGRAEALKVIKSYNKANPFTKIPVPSKKGTMRFTLPETGYDIVTLPELNNTGEVYALPLDLTFLGVDEESDMEYSIKYDDYNDKLKAEASFRLGTNIVWGKYFLRLAYTPS